MPRKPLRSPLAKLNYGEYPHGTMGGPPIAGKPVGEVNKVVTKKREQPKEES